MNNGIPCTWMRGGTSKGAYFLQTDLPTDTSARDRLLLRIFGSPDPRQIDGIGGADPLTSKVAIVSLSDRDNVDLDYLFLQIFVDQAIVTDAQNCGNILAGVGQFALEKRLVTATGDSTELNIYMVNSDQVAEVTIQTTGGMVEYAGNVSIDGVPGMAAAVLENFPDAAGTTCGSLLPSGNSVDIINDVEVTCIDNGMPVVIMRANDVGITGYETRDELDSNEPLKKSLEAIRLIAGHLMNLGDVTDKSVPKITLVAPPLQGGTISTRTFIPHRCHASIGVLGAVSVATACILENTPASRVAILAGTDEEHVSVEHPIGKTTVVMQKSMVDGELDIGKAAIVRTARKLFEGLVFPAPDCVK